MELEEWQSRKVANLQHIPFTDWTTDFKRKCMPAE
jgi:hypothetical protein